MTPSRFSRLNRPSPAVAISIIALFFALGGTGYAALNLASNSVGTKQLKANAVTSAKVKNRSLLALDFKRGQLPAGKQGPQGLKGDTGQQGLKGDQGDRGVAGPGAVAMNSRLANANSDNTTTLLTVGEMTVRGSCWNDSSGGGGMGAAKVRKLTVQTTTDATIDWVWTDGTATTHLGGTSFTPATTPDLVISDADRAEGQFIYRNGDRVISVNFHVLWGSPCEFFGTAVPAPG